MVPTFLQNRRGNGHALRLSIALAGLFLLSIGCVAALSMIIVDRDITSSNKLILISGLLVVVLPGMGLLERISR